MSRVDLLVPFSEKDEAKQLGARWDATAQTWFVPEGTDPTAFGRWLPPAEAVNVRSASFFLASSSRRCWRCQKETAVHGFMLPAGHETLFVGDEPDEDCWEVAEEPSVVSYIGYLSPGPARAIQGITRHYRLDHSKVTNTFYWMNHCECCGAKLGDHDTFDEPGEGFLAFTLEDAQRVILAHENEPFAASCGAYTIGVVMFEQMRRR